jgi:hypothetical protein
MVQLPPGPKSLVIPSRSEPVKPAESGARNLSGAPFLARSLREKWGFSTERNRREFAVRLHRDHSRLIVLVSTLEVGNLVVAFEMPDAGGDFVDEIVIVGH